jgi:hypothetical protein
VVLSLWTRKKSKKIKKTKTKRRRWHMKEWKKTVEWFRELEDYDFYEDEFNLEEKKRKETKRRFAEFHFGRKDGWHITTRP